VVADGVAETSCVFLAGLHRAERTIAERLMRLANGKLPWPWIELGRSARTMERSEPSPGAYSIMCSRTGGSRSRDRETPSIYHRPFRHWAVADVQSCW
jgi:hypothetical protein